MGCYGLLLLLPMPHMQYMYTYTWHQTNKYWYIPCWIPIIRLGMDRFTVATCTLDTTELHVVFIEHVHVQYLNRHVLGTIPYMYMSTTTVGSGLSDQLCASTVSTLLG